MYKLIIIEDNRSVLRLISQITDFEQFGFSVVGLFHNGQEALDFINDHQVDAVITDIRMPKIDGVQLAKICHKEFPEIKIIFLSAFHDFEYARLALRNDVFDYLTKPIDIDELNDVLGRLKESLDKQRMSYFSLIDDFHKRQKAYENITNHRLEDDQIMEELQLCGISVKQENLQLAAISFSIIDLESYLDNIWAYGLDRLYVAIYNLIPQDSESLYCLISKTIYDKFEILAVGNDHDDFEEIIEHKKNDFIENVRTLLNLEIECQSMNFHASFRDIASGELYHTGKNTQNQIVKKALEYIEEHCSEEISLTLIANQFYVSPKYLSILFKKETNENFIDYLTKIRMKKAKRYLIDSDKSVEEICNLVGYRNKSHFYKVFKVYFGKTPNDYRNDIKSGD